MRPGTTAACCSPAPLTSFPTGRAGSPCRPPCGPTPGCSGTAWSSAPTPASRSGTARPGRTTWARRKTRSPKPPRRCSPESSDDRGPASIRRSLLASLPRCQPAALADGGRPRGHGGRADAAGQDLRTRRGGWMAGQAHVPVLAGRVTALLAPALDGPGAVLIDATLGRAGHARALLDACPGLHLVGVDADVAAIDAARDLLAPYADRVTLVHARYDEIPDIVAALPAAGPDPVQIMGLLFDLGVSSPQLDDAERGFAYAQDAPLDMRMDRTRDLTAADVINEHSAAELTRV